MSLTRALGRWAAAWVAHQRALRRERMDPATPPPDVHRVEQWGYNLQVTDQFRRAEGDRYAETAVMHRCEASIRQAHPDAIITGYDLEWRPQMQEDGHWRDTWPGETPNAWRVVCTATVALPA